MCDGIENQISMFFIREAFQGDSRGFDRDTNLIEIAAIDSMSMMELVAFLEETFAIAVNPAELHPSNLSSVRSIADMVRRIRDAGPGGRAEVD